MAMVMDFLIGILLLLSAAINVLALGAFVVTPSLRSTSNRFVINLLIVNFVGCLILAPSLLFNSNVIRNWYTEETTITAVTATTAAAASSSPTEVLLPPTLNTTFNGSSSALQHRVGVGAQLDDLHQRLVVKGNEINATTTVYKIANEVMVANNTPISIKERKSGTEGIGNGGARVAEEIEATDSDTSLHQIRPWILDIIAAIGALSLVLVVGDTYCAVTDPLRYHSRISASRVCCLIVMIWCIAVGFGVSSAFRMSYVEDILLQHSLYNTAFGSTYFICIILIPFSLVMAMYWGIIREARKNGLRLRHNGSSPLLQSVLHIEPHNLACLAIQEHQQQQQHQQQQPEILSVDKRNEDQLLRSPAGRLSIDSNSNNNNYQQQQPRANKNSSRPFGAERGGIEASLRRNKSAQHLMCPTTSSTVLTCECCEQILITRSISNQSAYLNSAQQHLKAPNRDILRTARSTPELHQNLLLAEQGAAALELRSPTRPTKTLGYMTSIRHRLSNASSLFKYREESRAARISILVVIMFLVSYIPFGLLVLAEGHDSFLSTYQQTVLAIFFVVLANIISPLIFAYRNKRVRRGIQRLVSGRGRTGCAHKERGKGDNNGSIKELSERNSSSPKTTKLTNGRRKSGGAGGLSLLLNENNTSGVGHRRKLVIFNGRNGQITKVYHPTEHRKNFLQLKGGGGCNKDLMAHKNSCVLSRRKSPTEIGCQAVAETRGIVSTQKQQQQQSAGKVTRNDHKTGVKSPTGVKETNGAVGGFVVGGGGQAFLRRIRSSSGQIFKKSSVRSMVPQVNIDFPSTKPIHAV